MRTTRWRDGRQSASSRPGRRLLLTLAIGIAAAGGLPAGAVAAAPVALDAPDNGTAPLVAYSPQDKMTYVAWSAPGNQNGGNGVDVCLLPSGQQKCEGGAPVLLTDTNTAALGTNPSNTISLGGLAISPSGSPIVLGTPVETGTIAWSSLPGGAGLLGSGNGLQNGGDLISPVSLFYTPNNAVALPGGEVALFDSYDHFNSYFSDSPVAGPQTPSTLSTDTGNANNGGQFDDQHDTQGPVIAAEPAPPPAPTGTEIVVGAGANVSSNERTPAGCVNHAATGYGVDVGTEGAGGTLNSQGLAPNGFGLLACAAEDPTLASGGQAGIGVLEVEGSGVSGAGSAYNLDYRPFNATTSGGSFGGPVKITGLSSPPGNLDVSEDSGHGVYAMYDDNGLHLVYSADGGTTWDTPVLVPPPGNGTISDPTIAGVGGGTALIAYDSNPGTGSQTFLQAVDATTPVAISTPSTATSNGTTFTFTLSCAAACSVTVTVTVPAAGAARVDASRRAKLTTLATGHFSLAKTGRKALTLRFTGAGKTLFKRDHGHLKATLLLSEKTHHGPVKFTRTLRIRRRN